MQLKKNICKMWVTLNLRIRKVQDLSLRFKQIKSLNGKISKQEIQLLPDCFQMQRRDRRSLSSWRKKRYEICQKQSSKRFLQLKKILKLIRLMYPKLMKRLKKNTSRNQSQDRSRATVANDHNGYKYKSKNFWRMKRRKRMLKCKNQFN